MLFFNLSKSFRKEKYFLSNILNYLFKFILIFAPISHASSIKEENNSQVKLKFYTAKTYEEAFLLENTLRDELYLTRHKWQEGEFQKMMHYLVKNPHLTKIRLLKSDITNQEVLSLCKITNLQKIDLSDIKIEDQKIIETLAKNSSVSTLILCNNGLKAASAYSLALNTNLKKLKLNNNSIGDEGAKALATIKTLTTLHLKHNHIGDEGAIALSKNNNLIILNLKKNNITDKGGESFILNCFLKNLILDDNYLSEKLKKKLEISSKSHPNRHLSSIAALMLENLIIEKLNTAESRGEFLKNLTALLLSPNEQKAILTILERQSEIQTLYLSNFSSLENSTFKELPLETLVELNLYGCDQLGIESFIFLSKKNLSLKKLTLGKLNLEHFDDNRQSISFKQLKSLKLTDWKKLQSFLLEVPNLKKLNISECINLAEKSLDHLIQSSPRLEILSLRKCPKIKEVEIRQCAPHYPIKDLKTRFQKEMVQTLILPSSKPNSEFTFKYLAVDRYGFKVLSSALEARSEIKSKLIKLGLEKCNITDETLEDSPLILLNHLQELNLKGNKIEDAGAELLVYFSSVTDLNLKDNFLTEIGAKILAQKTNLKKLNLANNKIKDEGAEALAECSSLTSLNLSGNKLTDTGAIALSKSTFLKSLNLKNNEIHEPGLEALANVSTLTDLNLGRSYDEAKCRIMKGKIKEEHVLAITQNTNLQKLNISGNNIKKNPTISREISQNIGRLSFLTSLNINSTEGNFDIKSLTQLRSLVKLEAANISPQLKEVQTIFGITTLTWLNLEKNNIGLLKSKDLTFNKNLTWLDLRNNRIEVESVKYLLEYYTNLKLLNLGSNPINKNLRAKEIIIMLSRNTCITSLNLSHNNLECKHAEILSKIVNLRKLNLEGNRIGNRGAIALAKNSKLENLNLKSNDSSIKDEGICALAESLSLRTLNLGGSSITMKGAQALGQNTILLKLDLRGTIGNNSRNEIKSYISNMDLAYFKI